MTQRSLNEDFTGGRRDDRKNHNREHDATGEDIAWPVSNAGEFGKVANMEWKPQFVSEESVEACQSGAEGHKAHRSRP